MNYERMYDDSDRLLSGTSTPDLPEHIRPGLESPPPYERTLSLDDQPRVPVTLTWENITVLAPPEPQSCLPWKKNKHVRTEPQKILENVYGVAKPGSMVAIMGSSGSGKTVLLNVLTKRNIGALTVTGTVKVNGREVGNNIASISAYSQQQDLFTGTLKVREHLWFQAQLRLGDHVDEFEKKRRVEEIMSDLGLAKRADTYIGVPGMMKTLSGGERKRLSFAAELLTRPSVLFCDEPTTGLDSFMAQNVIETLKKLAAKGRTVLCTIHQPASEVYALFDQVLLLASGRVAYMGLTGDVLPFFASLGYPCAMNYNPADFFIHTLAKIPGREKEQRQTVERICDAFEKSDHFDDIINEILNTQKQREELEESSRLRNTVSSEMILDELNIDNDRYKTSWLTQFRALLWRSWVGISRDPIIIRATLVQNIVSIW